MAIAYDPSNAALFHPGLRPTVLERGGPLPDLGALCAEASRLAYLQFESNAAQCAQLDEALDRVGLAPAFPFSDSATGTQGFAVTLPSGESLVAFRGTEPNAAADLGTDLEATVERWGDGAARVHAGFAHAMRSVAAQVGAWIGDRPTDRLVFTGHSLGAALATLACARWPGGRLITFGSPRVGNTAFVEALTQTARIERYVDCCDIVTHLPPLGDWYAEAGKTRYIDAAGNYPARVDDPLADQASARADYLARYAWQHGNVIARDLADHAPINYVRAFFR